MLEPALLWGGFPEKTTVPSGRTGRVFMFPALMHSLDGTKNGKG
jgi:hypothetical protein